jgi:putative endonuclease
MVARVQKHRQNLYAKSFTARYNVDHLIYYRPYDLIEHAIAEEKWLKGGSSELKERLVNDRHPGWDDCL